VPFDDDKKLRTEISARSRLEGITGEGLQQVRHRRPLAGPLPGILVRPRLSSDHVRAAPLYA
jgi:hypothetical protein